MSDTPNTTNSSITVTLVNAATGQSESLPVQSTTTTVQELTEWAGALFGLDGVVVVLTKDGTKLNVGSTATTTLQQAGIQNGDLIAVSTQSQHAAAAAPANNNAAGGLDFSSLLSGGAGGSSSSAAAPAPSSGSGGGLDFSSLLSGGATANNNHNNAAGPPKEPVYYAGMNLNEAQAYNPHPASFCKLLLEKEHLRKELNYYSPRLAAKLYAGITLEAATAVWREEMVKGGIENALKATNKYHEETRMKERLARDANDAEAKAFFDKKDKKRLIDEQYHQVIEEYPESMGRVLMLYIAVKINGHTVEAFCDSGAQSTIMSKRLAFQCGIGDLIDERMAGIAVGVGTGKILGRVHICNLQIDDCWFPCTITVMDDPPPGAKEMPFLLGLDMLKRHTCLMDLGKGVLKFRLAPGKYLETPFLHEKDLTRDQGGTKGFDADKANEEFLKESMKEDDDGDHDDDGDKKMDDADKKE